MRLVLPLLIAVEACATAKPSEDLSYRRCTGGTSPKPAIVRRAEALDTALWRTGQSGLFVIVDSSTSDLRVSDAFVSIQETTIGAFSHDSGALLSRLGKGPWRLLVRRIGYQTWRGEVSVRSGFRDTVELWLGKAPFCIDFISVSSSSATLMFPPTPRKLLVDVRAENGEAIEGSRVLLDRAPVLFASAEVTSGRYVFRDVPAGRYRLLIDRLGFARLVDSVTVRPDAVDTLRKQLRVAYSCDLDCGELTFGKPRPWWLRWWPF